MDPEDAGDALVVLSACADDAAEGSTQLERHGAVATERRPVGRGRVLVYGGFPDDPSARAAVAALRGAGWPTVVRPAGGGHLEAWRAFTRPVEIGARLWVCFPWSEFDRDRAPAVVEIDTGRAFGAGSHPSTRLLLAELAGRLGGGERVLDVGCGSGVLSVCAARLGAASVVATDIDPDALDATAANAARNGVAHAVAVSNADVADLAGDFDVVVANIEAAVLIGLAPAVQARLARPGWVGLSGISPAQVSVVSAAYSALAVVSVPTDDDWAAIVASSCASTSLVSPPSTGAGPSARSVSHEPNRAG